MRRAKGGKRSSTAGLGPRSGRRDRAIVSVASGLTIAALAVLCSLPSIPKNAVWTLPVAVLCLLLAAGAARALLGESSAEATGETLTPRWRLLMSSPVVALVSVLPFLHSLGVGLLSDDYGILYGMQETHSLSQAWGRHVLGVFHRPLFSVWWWLGTRLWQGVPLGYHIASLALHSANAVLVFALGKRLIGSRYGAFVAAALWAIHPARVEPVTWLACSADLLCTFFSLLSLLALEVSLTSEARSRRLLALAAGVGAFGLALSSKEAALALPGVVVLWALLGHRKVTWRAVALRVGAYGVVLVAHLVWRLSALGGFGGYRGIFAWGSALPSTALEHLLGFFLPINVALLDAVHLAWLRYVLVVVMAAGMFWWVRGLSLLPAWRLRFWVAVFFVISIPIWPLAGPTSGLENSRLSYLPSIALAWLFGDLCAGRGIRWRRSGGVAAVTLLLAAGLSAWYVTTWQQARESADTVIAAGESLVKDLEGQGRFMQIYVDGLPDARLGAQIFRNCYPQALSLAMGRPAPMRAISRQEGAIHPDVIAASAIFPGEYVAVWQEKSSSLRIARDGWKSSQVRPGGGVP